MAILTMFASSCSAQKLDIYDTSRSALNIAKGTVFGQLADYPEEYAFNAYFLGGRITDYVLNIPVRLQGVVDTVRDRVTIHVTAMSDTASYKMRLSLVPNADFGAGQARYQYVDISFTKNLSTPPALWHNNSKLRRITYSARKCAVFLEVSGIKSPDWTDDGTTGILDYWISLCKQYFEQHAEYDASGNRIYFE